MITTFRRFRRYVRPYWGLLCAGGLLSLVDILLGLAQPWPLKMVVDDVLGGPGHHLTGPAAAHSPQMLLGVAVGMLLLIVGAAAAADYWSTWFMESAGQRIGNDLREAVFAHLQRLSLRYHGRELVGDLTARVTADVDRVQDLMVSALAVLLPNAILVAGMVAVMLALDPTFTALALAASPLMVIAIHRSTRAMKSASKRARTMDGRVAAAATESLGAIAVVQAFSLEGRVQDQFCELNHASLDANLAAVRHQARLGPVVDVTAALGSAVVLWFGALRVLGGHMTLGVLLVFLAYLGSLYKPIKALSKLTYAISRGAACTERVDAVLGEVPEVVDSPGALSAPRLRGEISFERVWFSYGREPVLRGIDLQVDAGEVVALVGATGAGKSTVSSLIPRFYDPDQGCVRLDGIDVRDYSVASLRSQVSLVLQDSVLFRTTLWDNIACGRPDASDADILAAARLALVDEFAGRLPLGYGTPIGERGLNLSGGQRQRVAIARAILRDSPILILDEPTSALDAQSERLVLEALENLMAGRTTLVIAHRLSTVRRADRIVVLADGGVVEQGTHDELLALSGTYARLATLQHQGQSDFTPPVLRSA